jgi:hypothetical protein
MEKFFKATKPLFYLGRILGLAPYSLASEGKLTVSVPVLVYSIIINVVFVSGPLFCLIHFGKFGDVYNKSVPDIGLDILNMSSLFTSALSTSFSLFRCRELIKIYKHVLYLFTLVEDEFVFYKRATVINLLLLGCVPYFIAYSLAFFTMDYIFVGLLFMPFLFAVLYGPFLVVVQFACLILLSKRLFSYINTCLADILTKVLPTEGDRLIKFSPPSSCLHSTKSEPTKIPSISFPSNKRKSECNHLFGMTTSLSQIVSARSRNLVSCVNTNSTCLLSPGLRVGVRLQIVSLMNFYDELCIMVRTVNSVYSVRNLVNVADAFISITASLFGSYFIPTQQQSERTTCILIFIGCWSVMKLLVLLCACTSCTEEVSKYSELPGILTCFVNAQ